MPNQFLVTLFLFIIIKPCKSQDTNNLQCQPSSCGKISNITYPFRLETGPKTCQGQRWYDLSCHNNVTLTLNLYSGKYMVESINYGNHTIRIVDPGVRADDCSSLPGHSLYLYNISFSDPFQARTYYDYTELTETVIFLSCENRVESPLFLDYASSCADKNSSFSALSCPGRNYSYAMVDRAARVFEIPSSCRVELVAMVSSREKISGSDVSFADVHSALVKKQRNSYFLFFFSFSEDMGRTIDRLLKMVMLFLFLFSVTCEQNECPEKKCSSRGPAIRFPFRIKGVQKQQCGYSAPFDLSCTKDNKTMLQLPNSAKFFVKKIDYKSQTIRLVDPDRCLPRSLRNVNLSTVSPFRFKKDTRNYTVFDCSSKPIIGRYGGFSLPSCLNDSGHEFYAVRSGWYTSIEDMLSCTKMYELVSVPRGSLVRTEMLLSWSTPDCSICESKGSRCRLISNTTVPIIECYGAHKSVLKLVVSASVMGAFVLTVVLFAVHQKNKKEENQVKVEQFLANYEAFKPTRYSYVDIKRITNQFSDEIGDGAYGTVYKGKLSNEVLVAVKVLNNSTGKGEEFINEVGIIGKIHHVNIVRMVGFCADGFRRALVYEFLPNGSLQRFISSTIGNRTFLGWQKMRDIALGIAKGIEYLHQGCDQRILHFDIKPHNVLLDHNLNPKVSDFGTAKLCSKDQSMVSMTAARGTVGYIAPEVFSRNFGGVSYKSDVYSFGMLLLEMVGSKRKNVDVSSTDNQLYLPEWIYKHLEQQGAQSLEIDLEEEEDMKIVKNLAIVGLWCIQWQPVDRPSMSVVVKMLEGKEELKMAANPFIKGPFSRKNNNMPGKYAQQELSVISELE